MKTAKEILDGKIYNRFDLARACEDVARFFEESEASSKLIISGKQFDDISQTQTSTDTLCTKVTRP